MCSLQRSESHSSSRLLRFSTKQALLVLQKCCLTNTYGTNTRSPCCWLHAGMLELHPEPCRKPLAKPHPRFLNTTSISSQAARPVPQSHALHWHGQLATPVVCLCLSLRQAELWLGPRRRSGCEEPGQTLVQGCAANIIPTILF